MSDKIKIKLEYPIPIKQENGNEIMCSEINIGRIKSKHLKILPSEIFDGEKVSPAKVVDLIAALAEISEEAAGEIDLVDLNKISEELGNFLSDSLGGTGKS